MAVVNLFTRHGISCHGGHDCPSSLTATMAWRRSHAERGGPPDIGIVTEYLMVNGHLRIQGVNRMP